MVTQSCFSKNHVSFLRISKFPLLLLQIQEKKLVTKIIAIGDRWKSINTQEMLSEISMRIFYVSSHVAFVRIQDDSEEYEGYVPCIYLLSQ